MAAGCHLTPSFGPWDEGRFNWLEVLLSTDRRRAVVMQLEARAGLPAPRSTPVTTPASIGPRMIAAFLARSALWPDRWLMDCGGSFSDDGWGIDEDLFSAFPALSALWATASPATPSARDVSAYWFLRPITDGQPGRPVMAFDTLSGRAWRQGIELDLLRVYSQAARSLDAAVSSAFPPAF